MTSRSTMGWIVLCGMLVVGCNSSGDTSGIGGNSGTGIANNCVAACAVISSCTQETPASCLAGCVGGLSCEELEAWSDEVPPDGYPCRAEEIPIDNCSVIDT